MTSYDANGRVQSTFTTEVLELSSQPLDQALFEIPPGYSEARNQQELYGMGSMQDMIAAAMAQQNQQPKNTPSTDSPATAPSAKRPGEIRIGVLTIGNRTAELIDGASLRLRLIEQIKSSGVDAVQLMATTGGELEEEAKAKGCDFILATELSTLKQSAANKIGGFLGRATGTADVKDRFEARFEFRLSPVGGGQPFNSSASAKEDGASEVAMNSAIDKEAQSAANEARKRRP